MTYDDANRLWTANAAGLWGNATFSYDGTDNLKSATVGGVATTFTIDAATNRTTATINAGVSTPLGYDAQGHLTQKGAQTFTFDRADLLLAIPGVESYRYDADGKRTVIDGAGTERIAVYDHAGRLLMDVQPGLPAGCEPASERIFCNSFEKPPADVASTRYVYLGRHLVGKDGGRRVALSAHRCARLAGRRDRCDNDRDAALSLPAVWRHRLARRRPDPATRARTWTRAGLVYMQARYYDPQLGRFLRTDPDEVETDDGSKLQSVCVCGEQPLWQIRSQWPGVE